MPKEQIICYHMNDGGFYIPSKCGDVHAPATKWLWGHMVTNKANRTTTKFACMFCPEGTRMNWITHAMFKKMAHMMRHEYIHPVDEQVLNNAISQIPSCSLYSALC